MKEGLAVALIIISSASYAWQQQLFLLSIVVLKPANSNIESMMVALIELEGSCIAEGMILGQRKYALVSDH